MGDIRSGFCALDLKNFRHPVFRSGTAGARELILIAALAPVLPYGAALAVALMARVVTTVSDLAWGGIGLAIARRSSSSGRHRKRTPALTAREHEQEKSRRVPEAAA